MNDRPTPETDLETNYCDAMPDMPWVDAEVARKLERERNEAREALSAAKDKIKELERQVSYARHEQLKNEREAAK